MKIKIILIGLFAWMSLPAAAAGEDIPDPFEAYEGQSTKEGTETASNSTSREGARSSSSSSATLPPEPVDALREQTRQGRWSMASSTAFSYDRSSNELLDGSTTTNSTYFARFDVGLGHAITNQLQVELVTGFLLRRLAREEGAAAERDWLVQARGFYTAPLTTNVGLGFGAALGGYLGSSERGVLIGSERINETTSTYGLITDALLGVAYAVNDTTQLRMLGNFAWLWGTESISSADANLSASTTRVGLTLGLVYAF